MFESNQTTVDVQYSRSGPGCPEPSPRSPIGSNLWNESLGYTRAYWWLGLSPRSPGSPKPGLRFTQPQAPRAWRLGNLIDALARKAAARTE